MARPKRQPKTADLTKRAEAYASLERAFAKRDWEGFYNAAEALSLAAFDLGQAGGGYVPLVEQKPQRKPEPEEPSAGGYTVQPVDAELVTFKRGATLFMVVDKDKHPVAFCDNTEAADLVARALSAYKP